MLKRPPFEHRVWCKEIKEGNKEKQERNGQKVCSSGGMGASAKNAGRRMA
jgi:hypothetical protein